MTSTLVSFAAISALAGIAWADPAPDASMDAGVDAAADAMPQPQFEPPRALGSTEVAAPPDAPTMTADVVVTVKIVVDATGAVKKVTLVSAPQPPFDDAVITAVRRFSFQPATFGGAPVPVEIHFTHTFTPPPPSAPASAQGPDKTAALRGRLVELGTRAPVTNATLTAEVDGVTYSGEADERGRFHIDLPPGHAVIAVHGPALNTFVQKEVLAAHQELAVTYYVERTRYDPYEIVVVSDKRREEVSRIALRGPEIRQVPGTFGDPFRVIQALPGVASVVSLLPFPVIRGASPAATGFLIDGTPVPLLYHLLAGPSVIHPEFIDEIQFFPGGAPAPYGGYAGGIIDGRTARTAKPLIDVDANLVQVGGFVRAPLRGLVVAAAARYGYPGWLLSLATNQVSLAYWDYQLRVDGGTKRNGWTAFAFGASDELDTVAANADSTRPDPPLTPALILGFHRLDLRYHRTIGALEGTARVLGGYDRTFSQGIDFRILAIGSEIRGRYKVDNQITLWGGLDASARSLHQNAGANAMGSALAAITADLSSAYKAAGFAELMWRPGATWLIRPGVRIDSYRDHTATKTSVDPRLTVRMKLGERLLADVAPGSDDAAIWLKASAGLYHQPPRFVVPLPGLDEMPLKFGLLRSYQTSLGAELPLDHGFQFSADSFFHFMDPTIFDLSTNAASVGTDAQPTLLPTSVITAASRRQMFVDRLTTPQLGRTYGIEVMLRRQAGNGVFGWISYTLSHAERTRDGVTAPYDFDRTHLLNVVAGLPLRRNWDLGVRAQYQSGLPATTTAGYNSARADGYVRFDLRIDKRAAWKHWLLDFYVDITNIALMPEQVTPATTIRYVLPSAGIRGRF